MTAHVHAALMLQYAKDATETDRPWVNIRMQIEKQINGGATNGTQR